MRFFFRIALLLPVLFMFTGLYAVNECPFNLVNDPYPGQCARYADRDNDGICDLSQSDADTLITDSVQGIDITSEFINGADTSMIISEASVEDTAIIRDSIEADAELEEKIIEDEQAVIRKDKYMLRFILPIYFLMLILTALSKNRKIGLRLRHVNQFWNWMSLASFIPVLLSSVLLILSEYSFIKPGSIFRLIMLHNLTGAAFVLSAAAHVYIKWQYYLNCIKRNKCEDK